MHCAGTERVRKCERAPSNKSNIGEWGTCDTLAAWRSCDPSACPGLMQEVWKNLNAKATQTKDEARQAGRKHKYKLAH
eukprot:2143409-Rhodomonas_salina.2